MYAINNNILDEFNSVKGKRVFDNKDKDPNTWSNHHLYDYGIVGGLREPLL